MTYSQVAACIKANVITDTSWVDLTATTDDPAVSYAIAISYTAHYDDFAQDAFPATTLKVVDKPYKAEKPILKVRKTGNGQNKASLHGGRSGYRRVHHCCDFLSDSCS